MSHCGAEWVIVEFYTAKIYSKNSEDSDRILWGVIVEQMSHCGVNWGIMINDLIIPCKII